MICRRYQFHEDTGVTLNAWLTSSDCKFCTSGNCSARTEIKEERLDKHKYGWTLLERITFDTGGKFISAIKIGDATSEPIWICKLRKPVDENIIMLYISKKYRYYENADQLNRDLIELASYGGRPVTLEDLFIEDFIEGKS